MWVKAQQRSKHTAHAFEKIRHNFYLFDSANATYMNHQGEDMPVFYSCLCSIVNGCPAPCKEKFCYQIILLSNRIKIATSWKRARRNSFLPLKTIALLLFKTTLKPLCIFPRKKRKFYNTSNNMFTYCEDEFKLQRKLYLYFPWT